MDGETQLVGILGHGIEYTMSPAIHGAAFHELGLNWAYVPLRVPPHLLRQALRGLHALGLGGGGSNFFYKKVLPVLLS
jgi:shikimate dehydrogenase